jgi:agmatine deiminase
MKNEQESGAGLYINYLHAANLVVVPQFGPGHADKEALQKIGAVLGRTNIVVPFNANIIAEYGGVLNCATWSVRE